MHGRETSLAMKEALEEQRPWADLRLVRGEGPTSIAFQAAAPMCLSVGSDARAGLTITAHGVAPAHFALVWDGVHLWLEDVLRLGRTRLNGHTLNEWRCVEAQAIVTFGSACMVLRSQGPAPTRSAPDFDAIDRVRPSQLGLARRRDTVRTLATGR